MDPARLRLAATSRAFRWALLGLAMLALVPLAWKLFGPRGVVVEVVGKTWQLEVEIEQRVMESGSAWCDELPADARILARRRIDRPSAGRPAGAEHCRYSSPQWRRRWGMRTEGQAPTPPRWPEPQLRAAGADGLGAERAGQRQARYLLQLHSSDDHAWTCELPLAAWQRVQAGTSVRIQVDRWSVANCASLPAF